MVIILNRLVSCLKSLTNSHTIYKLGFCVVDMRGNCATTFYCILDTMTKQDPVDYSVDRRLFAVKVQQSEYVSSVP